MDQEEMQTLVIKVKALLPKDKLEEDDRDVAGLYPVAVPASFPDDKAASCALDVFHSHIAIECLDDFDIYVLKNNQTIEQGDYESYSLTDYGELL